MKRRQFFKAAGVGVAATAIAAPAIAQSMPEIKWRMTTSWPKSLDTLYGGAEMIAKAVAEATDNKFQIQVFAGGEIVPGLQALDAVQNGTVELGHTAAYYYFGKDPTFAFACSVAFSPNARMNQAWYIHGGGKEVLERILQEVQHRIGCSPATPAVRWAAGSASRSSTVDDLKGLKMRIGGFAGRVLQKLGAVAAADRGRRHLSGAREGHHRRAPNGSARTTTRSSASTRSRPTTTIPAGGKAAP